MLFGEKLFIEDIQKIIPHRYPFLMIDSVSDIKLGESCVAQKNVSINEWYFAGHFPNKPIMPGVLIVEAMAQAAGVLACVTVDAEMAQKDDGGDGFGKADFMYFMSIDNAKFKRPVVPGDVLKIVVQIEQRRGNKFWKFHAKAFVGDEVADEADFKAMMP